MSSSSEMGILMLLERRKFSKLSSYKGWESGWHRLVSRLTVTGQCKHTVWGMILSPHLPIHDPAPGEN